MTKRLAIIFLFFGLIGFADAAFLTVEHYRGGPLPCAITSGCDTVTTSRYATIAGIPVALLGALYYLSVIIGAVMVIDAGRPEWLKRLARWTAAGFLASLYFVGLQVFVLKAYCLYCLISAGTSTALFITGLVVLLWRPTATDPKK